MAKKVEKVRFWDDHVTFEDKGRRLGGRWVSVISNGSFQFATGFATEEKLGDEVTHVTLGYLRKNNAITFEFTKDTVGRGALKLTKGQSVSIATIPFWKKFKLDPKELAGRYKLKHENFRGRGFVWVIDLDEKIASSG